MQDKITDGKGSDPMINIRQASYADIPLIMDFLDKHWKKGHIFARDRAFFEWQFLDGDQVNFTLGIDDEEKKIYGLLGTILCNHSQHPDGSGTIWKTIKSNNPLLGLDIGDFSNSHYNFRYTQSAGLSKKAEKINALLGIEATQMDHYYRLNPHITDYKIALVKDKRIEKIGDTGYRLEPFYAVAEMKKIISPKLLSSYVLSKDYEYIEKRYFNHLYYHYEFWKVLNEKKEALAVLITREEKYQDASILKIIDYYGDPVHLKNVTHSLDCLLDERNYEFVDVYSYGIDTSIYEDAGFEYCDQDSENIIPNYFHPFEQKNVSLRMAKPNFEGLRFFRGDGDQDRPC